MSATRRRLPRLAIAALALAPTLGLSGCGGDEDDGGGDAEVSGGIPAEFADLSNPFNGDADAAAAGEAIYAACAACHGADGAGGPQFNPPATDFTVTQSTWTDGYLFWRIRTGAATGPAGSVMPAYPAQSEDETWQVITYLRSFGS